MPWGALIGVFYDDGLYLALARSLAEGEPARYESAPAFGILGRFRDALRSIFP